MKSKLSAAFAATFAMWLPASADIMQLTVTGVATDLTIRLPPNYSTIFNGPLSEYIPFALSVRYDTSFGTYLSFSNWQGFTTEESLTNPIGPGSAFLNVTFMLGGEQLFSLANSSGSLHADQYTYSSGGRLLYGREYWGSFANWATYDPSSNEAGVGFGFRSPDIVLSLTEPAHYALTNEYRWGEVSTLALYQVNWTLNPQFIDISPVSAVPIPNVGVGLPGLVLALLGWLSWSQRRQKTA